MLRIVQLLVLLSGAISLSGCITTSMQGYADRDLPAKPVKRVIAYVAAQGPLATNIQSNIQEEARKHQVDAEDALNVFPPTRKYSDAEIRKGMTQTGTDAVLFINVGDTGVQREYAGTILSGEYVGSSSTSGTINSAGSFSTVSMNGTTSGTLTATSTPTYRYRRQTNFTARLVEVSSGRNLWVGNGQVNAGGLLFVGDGANASSSVAAIFDDLQRKGII
ncbi:hypothetical protein I3J27_38740 [Bradyrhizobium xenonodulans]|uniref:DUF4136 domain-containing protein n=1 Tax=Bradyrhizobium xenonodulans TaxID=2736875 RepID=A0ABY7MK64_9BRAD|nr:hypothetical protein [Bradyrhizobium xenonodulans]WBL78802.1 hypothetical protein I3J27_38740 [Bradyrhizobium xenonodulans]